jgi:cysteine desulfurase/selenocysteine lyase
VATGPISKELFIGLEGVAHFFAGSQSPMLRAARAALMEYCDLKGQGAPGEDRIQRVYLETKELVARYLRAPGGVDDIALLGSAAEGFNVLAGGIEWRPGDNVVTIGNEYPSSVMPWLLRRRAGVSVLAVEPNDEPEASIEAAITDRTRVVCVSYVNFLTGMRLDLERLATAAHSHGAVLAVDASQALGAIPIPIEHCDVLVSCCYKFQLGAQGVGIFYWDRRRIPELLQSYVGWYSLVDDWQYPTVRPADYRLKDGAGRFEIGNPSYVAIFVLNQAVRVLSALDSHVVQEWVLDLGGHLRGGLVNLGLDVWTPEAPARRGPNVVFGSTACRVIADRLGKRGVFVTGSSGRVRFSLHGYNDIGDVDAALSGLAAVL